MDCVNFTGVDSNLLLVELVDVFGVVPDTVYAFMERMRDCATVSQTRVRAAQKQLELYENMLVLRAAEHITAQTPESS
jgi:hypothetical protein